MNDIIGFVVLILVLSLVFIAFGLERIEQKNRILEEKLRISEVQTELDRLKSLPDYEVDWLRGEGFDVKEAIFACERALLIRMDVIR